MRTLTVRSCTRVFWRGVENGRVSARTPPLVFTTDCSFMLYPKMKLTCMQHATHQHADQERASKPAVVHMTEHTRVWPDLPSTQQQASIW